MQNVIPGGFYFANIFSGGRDKKFRGGVKHVPGYSGGLFSS